MSKAIPGIHHVTAIASDPQRNLDFYAGVLGLRLVKVTVNFDDPGTYHFYFGDEAGSPGTILTFFPWPGARRGRRGNGEVAVTAFSVPRGAISYWQDRLRKHEVSAAQPQTRFDTEVLGFTDWDGTHLELVAHAGAEEIAPWSDGPIAPEHAIRGFHGVTTWVSDAASSADLLTETMGFRLVDEAGTRSRFQAASDDAGAFVDIVDRPNEPYGQMGAGTVHHVAWRTANDDEQQSWRQDLTEIGYNVTAVRDRQYFRSIYFREPGGVLYEIATDPPGFTRDESLAELGNDLKLPPWLEPKRTELEQMLPPIRRRQSSEAGS